MTRWGAFAQPGQPGYGWVLLRSAVVAMLWSLLASGQVSHRALAAADGVTILQSSAYLDPLGRPSLVGELRNDSGEEISLIKLVATFYDAAGNELDRADGISLVSQLLPGETAPFVVNTRSPAAAGHARYEIASSYFSGGFGPLVREVEVAIDRADTLPAGPLGLTGHVVNTTDQPLTVSWVTVALCDEAGTVQRAASGSVDATLAPNERAEFTVVYPAPASYTRYRTWVTAHPAP